MLGISRITAFPFHSVCVPFGFPRKSAFPFLICITVESMTSPIVITSIKNGFLHTNKRHSRTIKTIRLPGLARALLTSVGSCRVYYVLKIKGRFLLVA